MSPASICATAGLVPILNSFTPLGTPSPDSPQVGFDDDGGLLLVTEKATNLIDTFVVRQDGTLSDPNFQPSGGTDSVWLFVRRPGTSACYRRLCGAAGESAVSSYNVSLGGSLHAITGALNKRSSCSLLDWP